MSLDLMPGIYHGALIEVVEAEGTGLFGPHAAGATVLNVAAGGFRTAGQCRVDGNVYAYTREGDSLTITPALVADAEDGTPVESLTPAGDVETQKLAVVDLDMLGEDDETGTEDQNLPRAQIPGELAGYYPLGTAAAGSIVDVEDTTYGYRLKGRPTDAPLLSGSAIDTETLPPIGGWVSLDPPPTDPAAIALYPEGFTWWQVDAADEVAGFWRLEAGAFVPTAYVTETALNADSVLTKALFGRTLTGTTIQTREEAKRGVKLGTVEGVEALIVYNDSGIPFLKAVPSEALAVIAGKITATTQTVSGGSSLGGLTQITRSVDGTPGTLQLTAYATAPKGAPDVLPDYDKVQFTDDGNWADRRGPVTDGTNWYTVRLNGTNHVLVEKWTTAGALVSSVTSDFTVGVTTGMDGVVWAAGALWVTYRSGYSAGNDIYGFAQLNPSTGAFVKYHNWSLANLTTTYYLVGTGVDPATGEILFAYPRAGTSDQVRIRRYSIPATASGTDLTLVSTVDTTIAYPYDIAGVAYGSFDLGANRYVFTARRGESTFRVVDATGAAVPDENFEAPARRVGFAYDGGAFKSVDWTGTMRIFTGQDKTVAIGGANGTKWVSNTLLRPDRTVDVGLTSGSPTATHSGLLIAADVGAPIAGTNIPAGTTITAVTGTTATMSANATGPSTSTVTATITRTIETDQSPRYKIAMPKRAKMVVTASEINAGGVNAPDRIRIYVGRGSADPGRTAMWKQTDPAPGAITAEYSSLATSGTNPPSTNGFVAAGGTIQDFRLADDTIFMDALGKGSPWTPYTPTLTATTTPPTLGSFTRDGRYARLGRNTVKGTLTITATAATGLGVGTYDFGLPVAPRDPNHVIVKANQSGPNRNYLGRGGTGSTVRLYRATNDAVVDNVESGMANGTMIRIDFEYEAA